ncbi:hypothetical protein LBMAG42_32570 [Deltaproteobacteria bacterium]|nr:hypothetical protein LBMAG42_32570 [Deltaproteobacteria bacterium]
MARVGLFGFVGSLAHAGRLAAAARALRAVGHEPVMFGDPAAFLGRGLLAEGEIPLVPHAEPSPAQVLGSASPDEDATWFVQALADDRAAMRASRLNCAVVDNRRSAGIAAEAEGIPWVSLTNSLLLGPWCRFAPTVGELAASCAPMFGTTPLAMMERAMLRGMAPDSPMPIQAAALHPVVVEAIRSAGARSRRAAHELNLGSRTLILDLARIAGVRGVPPGARIVGPILPEPRGGGALKKGVLLVAFGSTGDLAVRDALVAALATRWELSVAGAGAGMVAPEAFADAALVVCHGGNTTLYRAAWGRTPVLAIGSTMEQSLNAVAFARAGMGLAMSGEDARRQPEVVVATVERLLGDAAFREKAASIGASVRRARALGEVVGAVGEVGGG